MLTNYLWSKQQQNRSNFNPHEHYPVRHTHEVFHINSCKDPFFSSANCPLPPIFSSPSAFKPQHFSFSPANCQLPTLFSFFPAHCRLPTANYLLFLLSTQHSALSTSLPCPLPTANSLHLPSALSFYTTCRAFKIGSCFSANTLACAISSARFSSGVSKVLPSFRIF